MPNFMVSFLCTLYRNKMLFCQFENVLLCFRLGLVLGLELGLGYDLGLAEIRSRSNVFPSKRSRSKFYIFKNFSFLFSYGRI